MSSVNICSDGVHVHVLNGDDEVKTLSFGRVEDSVHLTFSVIMTSFNFAGMTGEVYSKSECGAFVGITNDKDLVFQNHLYFKLDLRCQRKQNVIIARKKKAVITKEALKVAKFVWVKNLLEYERYYSEDKGNQVLSSFGIIHYRRINRYISCSQTSKSCPISQSFGIC
jgi:hypothetical protein